MANIQSVKVIRNTNSVTVYINLDNGRFATWSKRGEKKAYTGSPELLAEAKSLAMVNGKWQNWSAPRKESNNQVVRFQSDEDARTDIESDKNFTPRDPGEPEIYG